MNTSVKQNAKASWILYMKQIYLSFRSLFQAVTLLPSPYYHHSLCFYAPSALRGFT